MRLAALPPDSAWSHALYPVDPDTGLRSRAPSSTPDVIVLDDPGDVDRFFARQAAG